MEAGFFMLAIVLEIDRILKIIDDHFLIESLPLKEKPRRRSAGVSLKLLETFAPKGGFLDASGTYTTKRSAVTVAWVDALSFTVKVAAGVTTPKAGVGAGTVTVNPVPVKNGA